MTINQNQGSRRLRQSMATKPVAPAVLKAVLFGAGLMLGGCTSTSTIDTAFSDIADPAPVTGPANAPIMQAGPSNTGAFPNLNDEPAPTLSAGTDNAVLLAEMQALAAARASGRISPAAYQARIAELQRLAATHSAETLRRIEGR